MFILSTGSVLWQIQWFGSRSHKSKTGEKAAQQQESWMCHDLIHLAEKHEHTFAILCKFDPNAAVPTQKNHSRSAILNTSWYFYHLKCPSMSKWFQIWRCEPVHARTKPGKIWVLGRCWQWRCCLRGCYGCCLILLQEKIPGYMIEDFLSTLIKTRQYVPLKTDWQWHTRPVEAPPIGTYNSVLLSRRRN